MYVQSVTIINIRGFAYVDLDLRRPDGDPSGWTVLAGRNGSGKSTLLRAIALAAAGPNTAQSLQESFAGWIRSGKTEASVSVEVPIPVAGDEYIVTARASWEATPGTDEPHLVGTFAYEGKEPLDENRVWSNYDRSWFLAGYGPFRRLTGHGTAAQRLMVGPDRIARLVTLFREDASLIECVEWLREIYLRRLEGKPGAADLEKLVIGLLNDGLLPDDLVVERVDSDGLWVRQHGVSLPLESLSDGYRTTAALVMDIVRHLHRCHGDGDIKFERIEIEEGTEIRILMGGVVLIDEIDLHLHVSWQQRIGFWLKRHFPNIQFIVATHSPFICQAADPRGLIRLPAPGEDRPAEQVPEDVYHTVVNGSIDDAVLSELFGLEVAHSAEAERLRQRVAELEVRLQTGKASEGDAAELAELRRRLPHSPAGDVEQVLRRLEGER